MLCLKNYHRIGFGIFLSVFFVAFLFSCLFVTTNTYAKEDISVSFTNEHSTSSNGSQIFGPLISSASVFTSYTYLIVSLTPHRTNTSSGNSFAQPLFYFRMNCTTGFPVVPFINSVYSITDYVSCNNGGIPHFSSNVNWSSILSSGETVTFTLTDSFPGSGSLPSGSITLTQNGTYDVTNFAEAVVDVPPLVEPGDYHDDLISIQQAIYVCGAILLVLYFFYCIYRILI